MNPFDYITIYHIILLHLACLVRLLVAYGNEEMKLKKEKKMFVWSEYFKDRWDNWALHYVSMWALIMILPPLVDLSGEWIPQLKEVKDDTSMNMLGTFGIGFFGYDAVKWILKKFKK